MWTWKLYLISCWTEDKHILPAACFRLSEGGFRLCRKRDCWFFIMRTDVNTVTTTAAVFIAEKSASTPLWERLMMCGRAVGEGIKDELCCCLSAAPRLDAPSTEWDGWFGISAIISQTEHSLLRYTWTTNGAPRRLVNAASAVARLSDWCGPSEDERRRMKGCSVVGRQGGAISGPELTSDPWMSICGDPCLHFNGYLMERKRYSVFPQHRGITQPAQKQYFYWRILLHHCSTCSSLSFHAAKHLLHDIYDITSVYNCNDFLIWSGQRVSIMWCEGFGTELTDTR